MNKYYCPECRVNLDKSEVKAEMGSVVEDSGHGSPTFYNKSKYYCTKHNPPVEVKEIINNDTNTKL